MRITKQAIKNLIKANSEAYLVEGSRIIYKQDIIKLTQDIIDLIDNKQK